MSQHAIADNNRVTTATAPMRFYTDGEHLESVRARDGNKCDTRCIAKGVSVPANGAALTSYEA